MEQVADVAADSGVAAGLEVPAELEVKTHEAADKQASVEGTDLHALVFTSDVALTGLMQSFLSVLFCEIYQHGLVNCVCMIAQRRILALHNHHP